MNEEILVPLLTRLVKRLLRITGPVEPPDSFTTHWKNKALEDFAWWLESLPDTKPATESATVEACDLFTVLSEFSALRQEIRFQNREQSKTIKTVETTLKHMTDAAEIFKAKSGEIDAMKENIRQSEAKKTGAAFFDVRDMLVRGKAAAEDLLNTKSFFRPLPKGADGIPEAYTMAIRRMDKALASLGIRPVETVGSSFDPKTMKAIGKKKVPDKASGIVIEEVVGGFVCQDTVLRTAQVIVAE